MSVFMDISSFQANSTHQKYQYLDEFERLIEVNKDFLNSNSNDINPFESTTRHSDHNMFLESGDSRSDQQKLLRLVENSSNKCAKIGNFNIYNRCVFFINNSSGNSHLDNQFKVHNQYSNREKNKETPPDTSNNSLRAEPSLNRNSDKYQFSSTLHSNKSSKYPQEKDNKLFYLHKNSLRPVLSSNIKSGIYKRILSPAELDKVENVRERNVFFSSTERKGKILTAEQFHQTYIKHSSENAENKEKDTNKKSFADRTSNFTPVVTSSKVSREDSRVNSSSEDNLSFLSYEILNIPRGNDFTWNRDSNEIIDPSKKRVLKVIYPHSLGLESSSEKKCNFQSTISSENKSSGQISLLAKNYNRGRQKKIVKRKVEVTEVPHNSPISTSTTRYGRISKPPQYIQTDFRLMGDGEPTADVFQRDNDTDFKYSKEILPTPISVPELRVKRNFPPRFQCNYCHKLYPGRRMQRHLEANPDHNTIINEKEKEIINELSLYKFLVEKVKQSPEEHRAEIFLSEISDLVDQLQSRGSRFVRNASGVHFVNPQSSKVLGIPEGYYSIDVSAIDSIPETEHTPSESGTIIPPPPPRLDYNLSISLDDTISNAKLNLPDNMVSSEDSLLRTVNDLVEQGINNLRGHDDVINRIQTPVIHYDHASDNAVEAATIKTERAPPILDLSLDLFQFNSN